MAIYCIVEAYYWSSKKR